MGLDNDSNRVGMVTRRSLLVECPSRLICETIIILFIFFFSKDNDRSGIRVINQPESRRRVRKSFGSRFVWVILSNKKKKGNMPGTPPRPPRIMISIS